MRPTLHDYVIEQYETRGDDLNDILDDIYRFTKLTNRAPRLGDFVPCDEDGLPIYKPEQSSFNMLNLKMIKGFERVAKQYQAAQDRVIFAGDWEVDTIDDNRCVIYQKEDFVITFAYNLIFVNGEPVRRIEELPREIEFKDGVI